MHKHSIRSRKSAQGFTLVEILIVVIILGILAAIVIPQFTNASEDARKSSLTSQLQTIRSQVELYKLQHRDTFPTDTGAADGIWEWERMTAKTDEDGAAYTGAVGQTGPFGPYLQAAPVNNLNGKAPMAPAVDDDAARLGAYPTAGWIFSEATGKIWATGKTGKMYDEATGAEVQ